MAACRAFHRSLQPRRQSRRFVTLVEACEQATSSGSGDPAKVIVLPPESGDTAVDSDVEHFDEDGLDGNDTFEPAGELEVDPGSEESSEEEEEEETAPPPAKRAKKVKKATPHWRKRVNFDPGMPSKSNPVLNVADEFPDICSMSPFELWQYMFGSNITHLALYESNLYANRDKNDQQFALDQVDLSRFFGILLLSGYHCLPEERDYWSNQPDLGVKIVSSALSRNRFQTIKKYIHFADNHALPQGNKVAKIAPLYDELNKGLVKFGVFNELLSVDEAMVPYFGRHSAKMFIRGKPIRFGYKIWSLCGEDGYPYHLKIYTGKEPGQQPDPLGTRVVNHMVSVIEEKSDVKSHQLFFDNFFSSYGLLKCLRAKNVRAVGTIRENRTAGASKLMESAKDLKTAGRGKFDYRSDGKVYICKWNDNSVVSVASNWLGHLPLHQVRRRVKNVPDTQVTQPHLIHLYNKGMGGVDLMDRLLSSYRPMIRGKKWYWPLFINALNITIVAAWRAHCAIEETPLSHLNFRREVTICLLKLGHPQPRTQVGGGISAVLPDGVRRDGVGHEKEACTQGRCKVCKKNARYRCRKCGVRLHYDKGSTCADAYHR